MTTLEDLIAERDRRAQGSDPMAALRAEAARRQSIPQYAPNGVPMNQAAKAEIAARAKAGDIQAAPSQASQAMDLQAEQGIRDPGAFTTIASSALQGATFGFGDEITARLLSMSPSMSYDDGLKAARGLQDDARFSRPKTAIAAEIAAALALPLGALKSTGKLGADVVRGAATGAGMSGLYGFGTEEGGIGNRIDGAKDMALLGGGIGAAIPVAGAVIQKGLNARAANNAVTDAGRGAPTTDQLRTAGNAAYDAVDAAGVQISPQAFDRARGTILDDLRLNTGFDELPGPGSLTPNSARVNEIMSQASARMSADPTAALPFKAVDQMRRQAGAAAGNVTNKSDQRAGMSIISGLDDFVENLGPDDIIAGDIGALQSALPKARETWANMSKSQLIDDAIDAGGDYLSGGSSGIRNQFKNILRNKKLVRGFSDAEKEAMRKVVNGSIPEQLLNLASGGLGQMATAIGGGAMGGLPGFLLGAGAAAGTRKLAERVTGGKAEAIRAMLANGGLQQIPQASNSARLAIERLMQQGTAVGLQQ